MKAKRKTRKKRSNRLRTRTEPAEPLDLETETEPDSPLFGADNDMENDIIDIDELEDFTLNPDETDESEW
uniref:Uncharacterized protein n=1 Tax=candidate division WOR-3 bacterium TaxID=2052148 RepID=A0A7C2B4X4_UNCW3